MKIERGTIKKINGCLPTVIYLDTTKQELFANQYAGINSWTEYGDKNIKMLFVNNPIFGEKFTKKTLIERVSKLNY